jgi:Rps23 Pro-64 3,4-dihydroxylase Tpa1-like proline 4-hydroxylase
MFPISHEDYIKQKPYPFFVKDNFLDPVFAKEIQQEILNLPEEYFDMYDNVCEKKKIFRDKNQISGKLKEFFDKMMTSEMLDHLSQIVGFKLINDDIKHYWGVHVFTKNSKLGVHVDAGFHPQTGLKKQLTLGYYLSSNWEKSYGSNFEIWNGESAHLEMPQLKNLSNSVEPLFNRALIFTCNDFAWHGVSEESPEKPDDAIRIFLTLSYMSENFEDSNKRTRAFFIPRPNDPLENEIWEFSKKRSSEECKTVYKSMN